MPHLCSICSQIPFRLLTCPSASDIRNAHDMRKKGLRYHPFLPFAESVPGKSTLVGKEPTKIDLGSLGVIKTRAEICRLCSLFYRTITRRGAIYANNRPIPEDDDNVVIIADVDAYHSYITEVAGGSTHNDSDLFTLRRLALKVYVLTDTVIDGILRTSHDSLAYYPNVVQPCHIDDFIDAQDLEPTRQPRLLFSARKRPDTIDVQLIRRWIDICQTAHELSCCAEEDDQRPTSEIELIRFIDVERNCISILRHVDLFETPYLALSYCWGTDQTIKLGAANEMLFQQDQSLPDTLPQTIQNAILLTCLMGFEHLWVDVLCILQGQSEADKADRAVQLGNMGKIYRESNVTIVAACGDTADAGLSGLRTGSRKFQQEIIQVIPPEDDPIHGGLALVSSCTPTSPWTVYSQNHQYTDEDLEASAWNTRAWTFQERALSRRCLVFTPEQVQWCCDGAIFCEESHFEPPELYQRGLFDMPLHIGTVRSDSPLIMKTVDGALGLLTTNRQTLWNRFSTSVEAYSRRQMTCEGDVYDAFRGLLEAFTSISRECFHWGHPRSQFEMSLMWRQLGFYYQLSRRTAKTALPMTSLEQPVRLPSWSWMGWVGPIYTAVRDSKMETETPEITCFEHTTSPLSITQVPGSNRFDGTDMTDIHKHKAERPSPPWKPSHDKHRKEITLETIQKHIPSLTDSQLQQTPPGHILFFWASSVMLDIQRPPNYSLSSDITGHLGGPEPKGTIRSTGSQTPVGTVDTMSHEHWSQTPDPSGLQEFIAVGRRVIGEIEIPGADSPPATVLALQIRWDKRTGIAERLNFGEIDEGAWMDAGPRWKLVALM